jgi:alpha-L-rhamnosidase
MRRFTPPRKRIMTRLRNEIRKRANPSARALGLAFAAMVLCLASPGAVLAETLTVAGLTADGRVNPLGIGGEDVSLGWTMESARRGVVQAAYEIRIGTEAGGSDVWESGVVGSDRQVDIALPEQVKLVSATRYWWQARVRDGNGVASEWSTPAWFETGLLAGRDWQGAEWIARPATTLVAGDWTDYAMDVDFTLHREALGVFLRTTPDARSGWMYQINVTGRQPVLKPHRKVDGVYRELTRVDLSEFGFSNESILRGKHKLTFDVRGPAITTSLDGKVIYSLRDDSFRNGLVGFRTHGQESATVHRVAVRDPSGRTMMAPDFQRREYGFTGGTVADGVYQISGDTEAVFTGASGSLPMLRGTFHARGEVKSARLYAAALGIYEISVNGKKAGDQFLAPGWTDYGKRIQHQTYDVTDQVRQGPNVIGAALADGWFRGKVGLGWHEVYGHSLGLLARIKLTYQDGTTEWFGTGSDWRAGEGPFVRADLQDGEIYDASREQPGWDAPGFDDATWQPVEILPGPTSRLVPQPDEPVRALATLTAKKRSAPLPGRHVYDLGQNMVGVARVTMTGKKGQTVTLRHAEELYRKGERTGQLYTDNLRTAKATDSYTFAADGTVTWQPKFTQHGFRYIELSGLDPAPAPEAVKGVVLGSDLPDTGDLKTSHPMLNQLVSNIRWGQRGNFLSIPTDTPARDERLGWTGDINVFAPTAARYQDVRAFLSKWMDDVRDAQRPDGNIPAIVPQPRREFDASGVGWSDCFITVPHAVWRATGDARIIRRNWEAMKRFYTYNRHSVTHDGNFIEDGRSSWFSGDWLTLEHVDRLQEHKVIGTCYFAENTRMMAGMAEAMGDTAMAKEWSALLPEIRRDFTDMLVKPDGTVHTGTQTAYAMALGMGLISDPAKRAKAAEKFVAKLAADSHHLRTGFLGTPWLLPALVGNGREDLACRLLLNETYPSWGFPISLGATTMWERWNSIRADGEFGPVDMNSFNHYAYGAVGDWMFGHIGGLQMLEPGYKKSRIAPLVGHGGLSLAKASLKTPYGILRSDWTFENGRLQLAIEVPVNTTAEVVIPTCAPDQVLESGAALRSADGVRIRSHANGRLVLRVGSGHYRFQAAR